MPLKVELVSPERVAYSGEAKMVVCRTTAGDIAFQPGHVPFVGVLQTHPVKVILEDGGEEVIAVHQGFVQVSPPGDDGETEVRILSDVCELSGSIDVDRAREAKERAEEALRADASDPSAKSALDRAEVRLAVIEAS